MPFRSLLHTSVRLQPRQHVKTFPTLLTVNDWSSLPGENAANPTLFIYDVSNSYECVYLKLLAALPLKLSSVA